MTMVASSRYEIEVSEVARTKVEAPIDTPETSEHTPHPPDPFLMRIRPKTARRGLWVERVRDDRMQYREWEG